jgi:hypothetical protein
MPRRACRDADCLALENPDGWAAYSFGQPIGRVRLAS